VRGRISGRLQAVCAKGTVAASLPSLGFAGGGGAATDQENQIPDGIHGVQIIYQLWKRVNPKRRAQLALQRYCRRAYFRIAFSFSRMIP
jgi:hypothetical protein